MSAKGARPDWKRVIAMRECYTLILARFFTDPVIYFVIFWLPEYLRKERGFDLAMVGKYRLGAVCVWRYRIHSGRLAVGPPDPSRMAAAARPQVGDG